MPNRVDILVFGPAGAGKTSLISTFYRALHEVKELPQQMLKRLTIKGTNENEGTTKYTKTVIKPAESKIKNGADQIIIHDTRG